jgi:hypothetical protein
MPRLNTVTVVRSDYDGATAVASSVLARAIGYMRARGFRVDDLHGSNATLENVVNSLDSLDSIFFTGVGHGDTNVFTGQDRRAIFETCSDADYKLRSRVVFLLSCLTGQNLGVDLVRNKGVMVFVGYKVEFTWVQSRVQDPLADVYARSFFEPVLELYYKLADGKTVKEAYLASIDKWNYWIDYWSKSNDPIAPLVVQTLVWDRDGQVLYGDENATIGTPTPIPLSWWVASGIAFGLPLFAVASVIILDMQTKSKVV